MTTKELRELAEKVIEAAYEPSAGHKLATGALELLERYGKLKRAAKNAHSYINEPSPARQCLRRILDELDELESGGARDEGEVK